MRWMQSFQMTKIILVSSLKSNTRNVSRQASKALSLKQISLLVGETVDSCGIPFSNTVSTSHDNIKAQSKSISNPFVSSSLTFYISSVIDDT